jgi:hypothetical protein
MAHVIQLCLGAFMSNLGVKGHTKSWEAQEYDKQFGENMSTSTTDIQKLWNIGNARIYKVVALNPDLAKSIEKITIISNLQ